MIYVKSFTVKIKAAVAKPLKVNIWQEVFKIYDLFKILGGGGAYQPGSIIRQPSEAAGNVLLFVWIVI